MKNTFYITTPIYYINDIPHIGHAYTTIAADVLARYHRLLGDDTFFLTGTDEHGAKVAQAAEEKGSKPLEFANEISAQYQMLWDRLNISNNDFLRTTQERHEKKATEILNQLKAAKTPKGGDVLYEDTYSGLYCIGCESYKTEDDLIDGKCPDHDVEPQHLEEKNWFFRLSDFEDVLKEKITSDEIKVRPESRKNEVLGLIKGGLKNVAISRQHVEWGIQMPFDKEQTVYVWIEALMNYITALENNLDTYWPAQVHLMAKDILKFHAVIWPAMLIAIDLEPPKQVFAHGFFTVNGEKMSKTLGNVIDPNELVDGYGVDASRYLLMSQFGFGTDGDIQKDRFDDIYNAHLANDLGNLVSRVFAMTHKYFESKVPETPAKDKEPSEFAISEAWGLYNSQMNNLELDAALDTAWKLIRQANAYVDERKPWDQAKEDDTSSLAETIYILLEVIRHVALMVYPFLPETADKLINTEALIQHNELPQESQRAWGLRQPGDHIEHGLMLFPQLKPKEKDS